MRNPKLQARRMLNQACRTVCKLGRKLTKYLSVERSMRTRLVEKACLAKNVCDGSAAIKRLNRDKTALLIISREAQKKSVRDAAMNTLTECN